MRSLSVGRLRGWFIILPVLMGYIGTGAAAPYLPTHDDEVLERLPTAMHGALRELRPLREQLARDPGRLGLATELARRYVEIGRAEFDPRYFGYAEAALKPWWAMVPPPSEVLLFRAILRQQRHDFEGALEDLAALLKQEPRNAQAWLSRAVILQVRGEQDQAMRHCAVLLWLPSSRFLGSTCLAKSLSLSGQAEKGYQLLRSLLEASSNAPERERLWAWTALAEMAARLGKRQEAEQHYRSARALGLRDAYLLMSYTEFLLDQRQSEQVVELLADETRIDGLLLRLALAEKQLGLDPHEHVATLAARFAASRRRGDRVHLGEQARLALHLLNKPQAALRLARANWAVQREPRDARVVLEAALAARDPAAARPVLEMIERTALQDVQLSQLGERLKATRR